MSVRVQITMRLGGRTTYISSVQEDWQDAIAFVSSTTRIYDAVDMISMVRYPDSEVVIGKGDEDERV